MKCPVCDNTSMREVEKSGIVVDICPDCKGVWLDRGELDKLMSGVQVIREEFNQPEHKPTTYETRDQNSREYRNNDNRDYSDKNYSSNYKKKNKKEKVLDMFGDLFG